MVLVAPIAGGANVGRGFSFQPNPGWNAGWNAVSLAGERWRLFFFFFIINILKKKKKRTGGRNLVAFQFGQAFQSYNASREE